tara:strand:- start:379 stop:621 length:243 start_codon:yes stop_codon:yes gene_type:complete
MILDFDLWFKKLEICSDVFVVLLPRSRQGIRNGQKQAVLIAIESPLDFKSPAVLAPCDTFHRQILRFVFAVFTVDWALRI